MKELLLRDRAPLVVSLDEDLPVLLRPLGPEDRERVRRAYAMLSVESRMNRFWEKPAELSPSRADSLTNTDHERHIAWAALPVEEGDLPGYAGASFWRSESDPGQAELAFTVADAWQRRGLATLLFSVLWHEAWNLGIREFLGYCRPRNEAIISWWSDVGGEVTPGPQQVSLRLPLEPPEHFLERVAFEMPPSFRRIETAEWMRRWVEETDPDGGKDGAEKESR